MTRSFIPSVFPRCTLVALAFASTLLAGCGSSADGEAATATATATASSGPTNMASSGPDGNSGGRPAHARTSSRQAANDADAGDGEQATDENGDPVPAGPPKPTEEEIRRAIEKAESK